MLVRDVMTKNPVSVPQDAHIDVAIGLIMEQDVSGLPVVSQFGRLVGEITELDVLKLYRERGTVDLPFYKCSDLMTPTVRTIQQNASLEVAASIFQAASPRRLLVLDQEKLVGVLSRRDIVRAIRDHRVDLAQV